MPTATTPSTTLTGFDMVWAITQNTVNSQLSWLHESGLIPNAVQFGDLDQNGIAIGGTDADRATISPPVVDFDTGSAKAARLTITFTGGNVSFYSGFGHNATVMKQPITGWKLTFTVNLNIGQIAHDRLTSGQASVPPEIQKILTQFDPSMFEVQNIFLDFQNSDMTNYDASRSVIVTDNDFVKQNFATSVGAWIKSHQGQGNPFILGYPVTRKTPPSDVKAVFEPTGANLSVHAYEYSPGAESHTLGGLSTLNFLLVTGDRKILDEPALFAPDAGVFHRNLVVSNDIDGRGIIARDVFFTKYLQGLLIEPFESMVNKLPDYINARPDRSPTIGANEKSGVSDKSNGQRARFIVTPTGWSYRDRVQLTWHESGFHSHDRESEQELQFSVNVSTQNDEAGAPRLTMDIHGSLRRYEWDQLNTDVPPFKSNVPVGKAWAQAILRWRIRLQFVAGIDGKITITKAVKTTDPEKDSGDDGLYKIADAFTSLLGVSGISDDWSANAASLGHVNHNLVDQLISQTGPILDGAMSRVVMPARSQFFYKNIQLNADGDIQIDSTYKSQG